MGNDQNTTIGDVAKYSNGNWLQDFFSLNIGRSSVDSAEIQTIKKGLEIAWDRRTHRIIIETDPANVARWLDTGASHLLFEQVKACMWLIHRPCNCKINLIRRSANGQVDQLANMGYSYGDSWIF